MAGLKNQWAPVEGHIMTRWAKQIDLENVLPEYPRPQLVRPQWKNLNGLWQYAIAPKSAPSVAEYDGSILVPFPVESALSGVKRSLLPDQRLWYHRKFNIPADWVGCDVLLHFGAVDYQAQVWLNGEYLGEHTGGNLPFLFEVSKALANRDEHELTLAVWDPSDSGNQQRGKQVLNPKSIWYTAASGIWQTVWLEPVPQIRIERLKLTPDIDAETIRIEAVVNRMELSGLSIRAAVTAGEKFVAQGSGSPGEPLVLQIPAPELWSPDAPFLYDLEVSIQKDGQQIDQVGSYFGMRKFHVGADADGCQRLFLNNRPLFQYGPLDQGYWPDGLYTAPTDEALKFDIEFTKKIGCNMIRKHIKVEPARWYYHCDRLGMIVWQDMPNGGRPVGGLTSFLAIMMNLKVDDRKRLRQAGRRQAANREEYRDELQGMVDWLYNAACIGMWVPFNEAWGQFNAAEVAGWLKDYDPTRSVDHASGWFDQGKGDFNSLHVYFKGLKMPEPDPARAFILSEFGGYSLTVPEHLWNANKKFGYRFYNSGEELTSDYINLIQDQLLPLIPLGLAGAVYTQTTDVEIEINGYLTYDREVEKMDVGALRRVHHEILSSLGGS